MLLQADLHTHTLASTHAYSTITENCRHAADIGLKCIAMTDHTTMVPDSPHIWHFRNQRDVLPSELFGVKILKGAEVNIYNYNGELDLADAELKKLDWVIASFHHHTFPDFSPADPKTVTDAFIKAMDNPHVDLLGHPTTTKIFPVEWERLVGAAKERGKLLELNNSSIRTGKSSKQDVLDMLYWCKKFGAEIAVDSDAHFFTAIGQVPLAEQILEEIDFPKRLIVNADWNLLRERVLKKRPYLDI